MTPCVDLRVTFGRQFRYVWDEAYAAERPDFRAREAPWLTVIPCRYGRIFPWGGRLLAAYCPAGSAKRCELAKVEGTRVVQGAVVGCPEVVVTFDVERTEEVAAILQARRRRPRASAAQRAALAAGRRPFVARRHVENGHLPSPETTIDPSRGV
jgi:hypothetical protein